MKIYGTEALKAFANQQAPEVRDYLIDHTERVKITRNELNDLGLNVFDGVCNMDLVYYVEKGLITYCTTAVVHRGYYLIAIGFILKNGFRFILSERASAPESFTPKAKEPESVKIPTMENMDEWLGYLLEVEREKEEFFNK